MSDTITESLQNIAEELKKKAEALQSKELEAQKRHIVECAAELAEIVNSGKVELTAEEMATAASLVERAGRWSGEPAGFFEIFRYWGNDSSPYGRGEDAELFHKVKSYTKVFQEKLEAKEQKKRDIVDMLLSPGSHATWDGSQFRTIGGRCYSGPNTDYRRTEFDELKARLVTAYEAKKAKESERRRAELMEEDRADKAEEQTYRLICKHYFGIEGADFKEVSRSSLNTKIRESLMEVVPFRRVCRTPPVETIPAGALVIYKKLVADLVAAARSLVVTESLDIRPDSITVRHICWGNQGKCYTADFALTFGNIRTLRFSEVVLLPEDHSEPEVED